MAALPDNDRRDIWAQAMADLSRTHTQIPISKTDLRSLINFMDSELDSAESSIFAALPAGDGKNWILANPDLGRELLTRIESKRREVL